MPLLGHGLVGLGIGAATTTEVRSPRLRHAWIGTVVTLAYLPDLLEWLAGLSVPHSGLASLPVATLSCVAVLVFLRLGLREKGWIALAAALVTVASHSLLDVVDGGIPVWWPLSDARIGPDWISNDGDELGARLTKEFCLFAPIAAAGGLAAVWRRRPSVVSVCTTIVGLEMVLVGGLMNRIVLTMVAGAALTLLVLALLRWRPSWRTLWQIPPLVPVLLLAGVQLYAEHQMQLGLQHHRDGDYGRALEHYLRCARFRPIGLQGTARCRIAVCHKYLGQEETAHRLFLSGLERDPEDYCYLHGMADLYLTARDERFRNPREAVRLAERLVAASDSPGEAQLAQRLLEHARQETATGE